MTIKEGCELCGSDVVGNRNIKYLCRRCNVLFDFKMIGLYIGRFQPFHKGHLEVIKNALKEVKSIIIVVTVPLRKTEKDPFSAEDRVNMIKAALDQACLINYHVYTVNDIPSDAEYVAHVREMTKPFNVVFVGENRLNEKLFSEAGFKVIKSQRYFHISSTEVRERMKKGEDWKDLVPPGAAEYIEEKKLVDEVK